MRACSAPVCEARLTPSFVALLQMERGLAGHANDDVTVAGTDPAEMARRAPSGSSHARQHTATVAVETRVSLRRDGARPLRFAGALVAWDEATAELRHEGQAISVLRRVYLYRSEDGDAIGQVSFHPPPGRAARPVYRASRLTGLPDLAALLREAGAEACFAVSASPAELVCGPPPVPGIAAHVPIAGRDPSDTPSVDATTPESPATR